MLSTSDTPASNSSKGKGGIATSYKGRIKVCPNCGHVLLLSKKMKTICPKCSYYVVSKGKKE